jgi:hypothetical protein
MDLGAEDDLGTGMGAVEAGGLAACADLEECECVLSPDWEGTDASVALVVTFDWATLRRWRVGEGGSELVRGLRLP